MKTQKEIEELWDAIETCIAHRMEFDKAKAKFIAFFSEERVETVAGVTPMKENFKPPSDPYAEVKKAFADGELQINYGSLSTPNWQDYRDSESPKYDSPPHCYRRKPKEDPYAEARAAYSDGELQVLGYEGVWQDWRGKDSPVWLSPPECYRRRPEEKQYVSFVEALEHYKKGGDFRHTYWGYTFKERIIKGIPIPYTKQILSDEWELLP